MPGFNQTGPLGQGPMTGRRLGRRNSASLGNTNDDFKNAIAGLVSIVLIGVAERIWSRIKAKRMKREQHSNTF